MAEDKYFDILNPLRQIKPYRDIDGLKFFNTIQEGLDKTRDLRLEGKSFYVIENGKRVEYIFEGGIEDSDLKKVEISISGGGATGDYIPLTGTEVGKPFNGNIEMSEEGAFSVSKSTQNVESIFTLNDDGLYFANLDTLYNLCFLSVRRDTSSIGVGGDGKDKRIEITKDSISAQSENNAYIATEDADILTKKFFDDNTRVVVTKPQLDSLITTSSLIPNTLYEISGCDADLYGGTTLYLRAVTNNELDINGIGKFYNPKYNQEVDGYGIYDVDAYYSVNDTTIWGGRKWVCKSATANEEPIDQFTLDDTKWNVVPYNDTEYNVAFDEIKYDYANDWIAERHEVEGGNIVSCSKATYDYDMDNYNIGYNAIKSFQWGNILNSEFFKGLASNKVNESWFDCVNSKAYQIANNSLHGGSSIFNNTINIIGSISFNTLNSSTIYSNTFNNGDFVGNVINKSVISFINLNGGSIHSNVFNIGGINLGTLTTKISNAIFNATPSATLGATAKTILASQYSKEVKTNASNQTVIQYINASNQLTIVPITS